MTKTGLFPLIVALVLVGFASPSATVPPALQLVGSPGFTQSTAPSLSWTAQVTATSALPPSFTPTAVPTSTLTLVEMAEMAKQSTVYVESHFRNNLKGAGTGIIIDKDGWILTSAHVVEGAITVEVRVPGRTGALAAQVLGISMCDDLAILKVSSSGLVAATIGDSDSLKEGEDVIAIGYPEGQQDPSVTRGIVSRLHATMDQLQDLVQTDASINPGNSGGPLVNSRGQVIGIVAVKSQYDNSGNAVAGMAYAVSSNLASKAIPDLRQGKRPYWLGLHLIAARDVRPDSNGLIVVAIAPESPAERAGFQYTDVLLSAQGLAVNSKGDLCKILLSNPSQLQFQKGDNKTKTVVKGTIDMSTSLAMVATNSPSAPATGATPGAGSPPTKIAPSSPTVPPTAVRTTTAQVRYSDDFGGASCSWEGGSSGNADIGCVDGHFQFKMANPRGFWFSRPKGGSPAAGAHETVAIGGQVMQTEGSTKVLYGFVFRYQDTEHFYVFVISSDGKYEVQKQNAGKRDYLVGPKESPRLKTGLGSTNSLTVATSKSTIVVYINGEVVETLLDSTSTSGQIGMTAGARENDSTPGTVLFDNVAVAY
jgi:S1-C subfamily serine protease